MKFLKSIFSDLYKVVFVVTFSYTCLGAWTFYKSDDQPSEKEVETIVAGQGIGDLIEPPKPFIVNHPPKTPFPAHWGQAPKDLGNGGTYLPAPYGGWGSYELVIWILENQNYDLYKSK